MKHVLAFLLRVVVFCAVILAPLKFAWGWSVPALAPGAVEQGLVAGTISLFTALKLAASISMVGVVLYVAFALREVPVGDFFDPQRPLLPDSKRAG